MKSNKRYPSTAKTKKGHTSQNQQPPQPKNEQNGPGKTHGGSTSQGENEQNKPKKKTNRRTKTGRTYNRPTQEQNSGRYNPRGLKRRLRRRIRNRLHSKFQTGTKTQGPVKQGIAMHLEYLEKMLYTVAHKWPALTAIGAGVLGMKAIAKYGAKKVVFASLVGYLASKLVLQGKTNKSNYKGRRSTKTY